MKNHHKLSYHTSNTSNLFKYRKSTRYYCGLKQAIHALKASKCKMIIIAPNIEHSQIWEKKLTEMVHMCKVLQVPLYYALSKKQLGKALSLSMKQSVIAVLNVDGAASFDLYRKIIRFVEISEQQQQQQSSSTPSTNQLSK
jgi:ribosomal protein L7Ae-like RNA K-turn-binding protein